MFFLQFWTFHWVKSRFLRLCLNNPQVFRSFYHRRCRWSNFSSRQFTFCYCGSRGGSYRSWIWENVLCGCIPKQVIRRSWNRANNLNINWKSVVFHINRIIPALIAFPGNAIKRQVYQDPPSCLISLGKGKKLATGVIKINYITSMYAADVKSLQIKMSRMNER